MNDDDKPDQMYDFNNYEKKGEGGCASLYLLNLISQQFGLHSKSCLAFTMICVTMNLYIPLHALS
jgi:hypothetical protein